MSPCHLASSGVAIFSIKGWCFVNPASLRGSTLLLKRLSQVLEEQKRGIDILSRDHLSPHGISIALTYKFDLVFHFIKFFKLAHSYGSLALFRRGYV